MQCPAHTSRTEIPCAEFFMPARSSQRYPSPTPSPAASSKYILYRNIKRTVKNNAEEVRPILLHVLATHDLRIKIIVLRPRNGSTAAAEHGRPSRRRGDRHAVPRRELAPIPLDRPAVAAAVPGGHGFRLQDGCVSVTAWPLTACTILFRSFCLDQMPASEISVCAGAVLEAAVRPG